MEEVRRILMKNTLKKWIISLSAAVLLAAGMISPAGTAALFSTMLI